MRFTHWGLGLLLTLSALPAVAADDKSERSVYSGDESAYVVQKRAYSKKGKFELTPMFFGSMNPKFVGFVGGGLSAAYHFRENLAIELVSSIPKGMYSYYSSTVEDLFSEEGLHPDEVSLKQMTYFGGLNLQLSALYGKFRFSFLGYNTLIDYDAYVTAGAGMAQTKETCVANSRGCSGLVGAGRGLRSPADFSDEWKVAGSLGGGMRFYFSKMFGLKLEVRDFVYADRKVGVGSTDTNTTTEIRNNIMFIFGFSVLI